MIGFVTGSDGAATLAEGLGNLAEAHTGIVFKGGMARVAMSAPPDITAPLEEAQDWNDACGLLSFVMYALDREDWMKEFVAYEELIRDSILEAVDRERGKDARDSFQVIQGGLSSKEVADEGE